MALFIMNKLYTFLFLTGLFCVIIATMGLFNWGALPKAQDDPTTIDEAIASAISAHESDPTAHLGDGESLQAHKSNEVIDHPASSIVSDKFSRALVRFSDNFSNLTLWNKTGNVSNANFPALEIDPYYGGGLTAKVYAVPTMPTEPINFSADFRFSFWGYFEPIFSDSTMWASLGMESGLSYNGMGFVVHGGHLYAKEFMTTAHAQEVDLGTSYLEGVHFFVMQYSKIDNVLYFYVDNVQVASITPYDDSRVAESGVAFGATCANSSGREAYLKVQDFEWIKDQVF